MKAVSTDKQRHERAVGINEMGLQLYITGSIPSHSLINRCLSLYKKLFSVADLDHGDQDVIPQSAMKMKMGQLLFLA